MSSIDEAAQAYFIERIVPCAEALRRDGLSPFPCKSGPDADSFFSPLADWPTGVRPMALRTTADARHATEQGACLPDHPACRALWSGLEALIEEARRAPSTEEQAGVTPFSYTIF
jgi:hypothetical protein